MSSTGALAALLAHLADLIDEMAVSDGDIHPDGTIHIDPRAVRYHVDRVERLCSMVAGVVADTHCTPYIPHCMGRVAGSDCTCDVPRLVVPRISRRAAAKLAPSRRTSTGRLLVEVPE